MVAMHRLCGVIIITFSSTCCYGLQAASAKVMQFMRDNLLSGTNPTVDVGKMCKMAGGGC